MGKPKEKSRAAAKGAERIMPITRELYEAIDLPLLERWVAEQQQEDLRLDFKIVAGGSTLNKDDRRNLTEAVSGFANADGGLIVWGIDARKNADNVDAACALKPVASAAAVLSQLREHPGQVTSPVVDGVEHRLIEGAEAGTGYLLTFIPTSDRGPHMASDKRYYKRNGASFLKMEHFDVADMFGRRQRPDVRLVLGYTKEADSTGDHHKYRLMAKLRNHGRARAREFKVIISMPADVMGWDPTRVDRREVDRRRELETQMRDYVHFQNLVPLFPGEEVSAQFDGQDFQMTHALHDLFHGRWPTVTITIYQDDCPPTYQRKSFEHLNNF